MQFPVFFDFHKKEEENHAENAFICHSRCHCGISGSASQKGMHNSGMNERNEVQEKLLGILLAAAAALLCAAIDYFMKQEDDKP